MMLLGVDEPPDGTPGGRRLLQPDPGRVETVTDWERWVLQANLLAMDINAILAPVMDFLATDFGRVIVEAFQNVFNFLFPSNAEPVPGPTN
jgi:hypothetical protein